MATRKARAAAAKEEAAAAEAAAAAAQAAAVGGSAAAGAAAEAAVRRAEAANAAAREAAAAAAFPRAAEPSGPADPAHIVRVAGSVTLALERLNEDFTKALQVRCVALRSSSELRCTCLPPPPEAAARLLYLSKRLSVWLCFRVSMYLLTSICLICPS